MKIPERQADVRFLASVFHNHDALLGFGPVNLKKLVKAVGDDSFFPMALKESILETGALSDRCAVKSFDGDWIVTLGSKRIEVQRVPGGDDLGLAGSINAFAERASELLHSIVEAFGIHGHRVAVVQEFFLREDPLFLREIFPRLLRSPPSQRGKEPFEWDWRTAWEESRQVEGHAESFYRLLTLRRTKISFERQNPALKKTFDTLYATVDVNTTATSTLERFSGVHLKSCIEDAARQHDELWQDFESLAREGVNE